MIFNFYFLYSVIGLLSVGFILFLKQRVGCFLPVNSRDNAIFANANISLCWFVLSLFVVGFCFFVSADFVVAAFYAIFIVIALLIVFADYKLSTLRPQYLYSALELRSPKPIKSVPLDWAKSLDSFLRIFNIVIIAPLLGAITGVLFHALVDIPEVDLIVFTAFAASLSFAGFITYFASTRNNLRALLYGAALALAFVAVIVLSGKVVMK